MSAIINTVLQGGDIAECADIADIPCIRQNSRGKKVEVETLKFIEIKSELELIDQSASSSHN